MKRIFKSIFLIIIVTMMFSYSRVVHCKTTQLIDTPTTKMLDYSSYNVFFRFFSEGGVLGKFNFGIFKAINLGFGIELNRVIGPHSITFSPPSLFIKVCPYEGDMNLPAVAFGYDGQGYFYDSNTNEFLQDERGLFLLIGREIITPGLEFNIGCNMSDFKENIAYAFTNLSYNIEDKIIILSEYDNINTIEESRLSFGMRFYITDDFSLDLAVRDIGSSERYAQRIVHISYTGLF